MFSKLLRDGPLRFDESIFSSFVFVGVSSVISLVSVPQVIFIPCRLISGKYRYNGNWNALLYFSDVRDQRSLIERSNFSLSKGEVYLK